MLHFSTMKDMSTTSVVPSRKRTVSPSPCDDGVLTHGRNNKRRRRETRHVRFSSEQNEERTFDLYSAEKTEEDKKALRRDVWYTKAEYSTFLAERSETVHRVLSYGLIHPELFCTRGLEPYLCRSLSSEMYAHRTMHHQTVLTEFARQRRAQQFSSQRLAQKVSSLSSWSLRRAQNMARVDERDACDYQYQKIQKIRAERECTTPTLTSNRLPAVPVSPIPAR